MLTNKVRNRKQCVIQLRKLTLRCEYGDTTEEQI